MYRGGIDISVYVACFMFFRKNNRNFHDEACGSRDCDAAGFDSEDFVRTCTCKKTCYLLTYLA